MALGSEKVEGHCHIAVLVARPYSNSANVSTWDIRFNFHHIYNSGFG